MAENQDTTYSCFLNIAMHCIGDGIEMDQKCNSVSQTNPGTIYMLQRYSTFLHKYQPGEEALRKMQEYPSNILNVTNVIYMRCMLTLQQD